MLLADYADRWNRRSCHVVAKEEACVRRLVIDHVLPSNAEPILRVLHECVQPMFCRNRSRVNTQGLAIGRSHDDLFTPVTNDVANQVWTARCAATNRTKDRFFLFRFPIPFCNPTATINQFSQ